MINPWHHDNNASTGLNIAGVCTTVSLQMLMGYHNYYSDRRIIPITFLGANYGNLANHPAFQRNRVGGQGCQQIGTTDDFFHELYEAMLWPGFPGLGQAVGLVKDTGIEFMNNHTPQAARNNISLTSGNFSAPTARADIDAGRPIVLGMALLFQGNFHVVPAYGYAKLDGVDGFLVHYGWGNSKTQVWIPSSWFGFQIRMSTTHTHSFVEGGNRNDTHRDLTCSVCGVQTTDSLYNLSNGTIAGVRHPLTGLITIPNAINCYNTVTASFASQNITGIGSSAFANQTQLSQISITGSVTSIGADAFAHCYALSSVTFGDNSQLTNISMGAFFGCGKLTSITIPNSVKSLGHASFAYTGLQSVSFGTNSNLQTISTSVFYGTPLKSIVIPATVTSIGDSAFYDCNSLKTVYYGGTNINAWEAIGKGGNNTRLTSSTRYYFSKNKPTQSGNYWRFVESMPIAWNSGATLPYEPIRADGTGIGGAVVGEGQFGLPVYAVLSFTLSGYGYEYFEWDLSLALTNYNGYLYGYSEFYAGAYGVGGNDYFYFYATLAYNGSLNLSFTIADAYDTDRSSFYAQLTNIDLVYAVTLDGGTSTIYEKYGEGWYSNLNATNTLLWVPVPYMENYTFLGYFTSEGIMVINANGVLVADTAESFHANGTLHSYWEFDWESE